MCASPSDKYDMKGKDNALHAKIKGNAGFVWADSERDSENG
jgi:hypothetical protein